MIDMKRGHWTMLWPTFFMTRRVLFTVGVCAMTEYAAIQIYFFIFPTIAVMMLLALVKPLQGLQTNRLEIYNSFTLLLIGYCLMCFTQFVLDAGERYNVGYALVALTIKNIIVNIVIVGKEPVRMCKMRCKKRWQSRH